MKGYEDIEALIRSRNYQGAIDMMRDRPPTAEMCIKMSKMYLQTEMLDESLENAEQAVRLTDGSEEAQLRRAISLWRLSRRAEAKGMIPYLGHDPESESWRHILSNYKDTAKVDRIPETKEAKQAREAKEAQAREAQVKAQGPPKPRMDWYQTPSTAYITLYKKDFDGVIKIESRLLTVQGADFDWTQPIYEVDTEHSTFDITPYKVEFTLKKGTAGHWDGLNTQPVSKDTKPDTKQDAPSASKDTKSATKDTEKAAAAAKPAPTLEYSKWDHLDDSEPESGDPMDFFKKIYGDANDDTRRAMMKSYTESNGTTLSTDWKEVSKGKVPTQPPKDFKQV